MYIFSIDDFGSQRLSKKEMSHWDWESETIKKTEQNVGC